ncbi:MAG: carboxylating nicotinate-nucleotide diphosphorylase [Candidatus Brocadiales bacterium]
MKEVLEISKIAEPVRLALEEDIGKGDITTNCIIPQNMVVEADIVVKERGIICGLPVAEYIFSQIPLYPPLIKGGYGGICFTAKVDEGAYVEPGYVVANAKGSAQILLTDERVVLNFLQRLSGIATITSSFVKKVCKYNTQIFDTRKTTPNWRYLERYAVRVGGGKNHRAGLYDQILIKDNHLKCMGHKMHIRDNTIGEAVQNIRKAYNNRLIEVEVESLEQARQSLDAGVDIIMLDNMDLVQIEQAVKMIKEWRQLRSENRPLTEVSGNVTLETVEEIAQVGVDRISIGALTHSVKALDISLEIR